MPDAFLLLLPLGIASHSQGPVGVQHIARGGGRVLVRGDLLVERRHYHQVDIWEPTEIGIFLWVIFVLMGNCDWWKIPGRP